MINLSQIWRFLVALFDWRTALRWITGRPLIDVCFITNMRDEVDKARFLGNHIPKDGHFNGPRYWLGNIAGRVRSLNILPSDLKTDEGNEKARRFFLSAVSWAEKRGARVILLAASTKRLFGESGAELKKLYPNLIFTIGDNGTAFILKREVLVSLAKAGLNPSSCRVGVLGAYGFLGKMMVRALKEAGYQNIVGIGPNMSALLRVVKGELGVDFCSTIENSGKLDAVIACTHSQKCRLNADNLSRIRIDGKKILVIDVAEPSNLTDDELRRVEHFVIRQDAGNAYCQRLKYVLGPFSYKLFRMQRGMAFGCFSEAMAIASMEDQYPELAKIDWFLVNDRNMGVVASLFDEVGFEVPLRATCFGHPVKSFYLGAEKLLAPSQQKQIVAGVH